MFYRVSIAIVVSLIVNGPVAAAPPRYTITPLPTSGAAAINNQGHVTGTYLLAGGGFHGFLYRDGALIDLGTLGGTNSSARGINDRGDVVGWSETATEARRAFLFSNGVLHDLGMPVSMASDINNQRQIVGVANGI